LGAVVAPFSSHYWVDDSANPAPANRLVHAGVSETDWAAAFAAVIAFRPFEVADLLEARGPTTPERTSSGFWRGKRLADIAVCLLAAPVALLLTGLVLLLNPVFNPGPLFYWQERMGRGCRPFWMVKFRTMRPAAEMRRGAGDPLEVNRITPLGGLLRRMRLDEVPQLWNVLMGDMSLIGPRPDYLPHAEEFMASVPGYRQRYEVRPGISGLAQVRLGYTEGAELCRAKVRKDLLYIRRAGWRLELYILLRTFWVMASGYGAR